VNSSAVQAEDNFLSFLNSANTFDVGQVAEGAGTSIADPTVTQDSGVNDAAADPKVDAAEDTKKDDSESKSDASAADANDDKEADDKEKDEDGDITKLSEKIEALEKGQEKFEESLEKVEELAGNKAIVVGGTSKSTMKISGRIHLDGWGFDTDEDPAIDQFNGGTDPQNRLGFRRLRIGLAGKIKDNMIYKIEFEFAGANDLEFRDNFIGWTDLPFLQEVLAGNQKRPLGLDHLNSSRHNVFLERPAIIEAFNEDARRLGLQSYGISDDLVWNWRYGVFNQRNIQDEGEYVGDHLQLQLAGRLATTYWYDETSGGRGYGHFAISGSHADVSNNSVRDENNQTGGTEGRFRTRPEARTDSTRWLDTGRIAGADYYDLIGLESALNLGSLQIVGEYMHNWVERDGFDDVDFGGGYVYASYFLTGEHMPWDRESGTIDRVKPFQNFWLVDTAGGGREAGWGALQVAARYSQADFTDGDIFGGIGENWTFGMNWFWNENAKLQFNYVTGKISDSTVGDRAGAPVSGDYDIYGVRAIVDF
jgi:phosphate-selective porin OprO/OprP